MGGGLLNLVSYGNINVFITGNPQKSFFVATYKKYTNFGLQKHIINCNITTSQLQENNSTTFNFKTPLFGDLLLDTFFMIQMPYIWSPVWIEPSDRNITPGGCGTTTHPTGCNGPYLNHLQDSAGFGMTPTKLDPTLQTGIYKIRDSNNSGVSANGLRELGSAQMPHCQPYEFKWIEDLGAQLISKIIVSIGGTIIQEFSGEYLKVLIDREYNQEKKELFNRMTGNIPEMNNPSFAGKRNGQYPNCVYASTSQYTDLSSNTYWSLYNNLEELTQTADAPTPVPTNLTPSIDKRLLIIPLNVWYMLSTSNSFPLISLTKQALHIKIECRPIRELFVVRNIRQYINQYYGHSFGLGNTTQTGTGISIYQDLSANYYKDYENACNTNPCMSNCWSGSRQLYYSQFNIFKPYVPPPFISTINTTDSLYQLYMFTTQYASINQALVQQAALQTTLSVQLAAKYKSPGNWSVNPRLCSTYVYLEEEEQRVFKSSSQKYIIKQFHSIIFENSSQNRTTIHRFMSNNMVLNWTWFLQRTDVYLRNQWGNYSNWKYKGEQEITLQSLFYKKLEDTTQKDLLYQINQYNTSNPDQTFNEEPQMFELTTANMLPNNFLYNNYTIDSSFNYQPCDYTIGNVHVGPGMDTSPPYFPFTYNFTNSKGIFPYITGPYRDNHNSILNQWAVLFDGKYREEKLAANYYNTVEQFLRNSGGYTEGLYSYNFSLNSSPYEIEPHGAMNLIHNNHIDFECDIFALLPNTNISQVGIIPICDISDNQYGYNKTNWQINYLNYNLKLFEETYNQLTIENGEASLDFNHFR